MKKEVYMRRVILGIASMLLCGSALFAYAGLFMVQTTVAVGATSTAVLAATSGPGEFTATRQYVSLQNDSDTVMYCNTAGAAAVVGAGTRLSANGGGKVWDARTAPNDAITCIHGGSGTKSLLVESS